MVAFSSIIDAETTVTSIRCTELEVKKEKNKPANKMGSESERENCLISLVTCSGYVGLSVYLVCCETNSLMYSDLMTLWF